MNENEELYTSTATAALAAGQGAKLQDDKIVDDGRPAKIRNVGYARDVPLADMARYRDNPHQRYTLGRAGAAAHSHLEVLEAPHREFDVIHCLEDGNDYLINGHTRLLVWRMALQPVPDIPETVNVMQWEAATLADVSKAYQMWDSPVASKSTSDEVYGTMRELAFTPKSAVLKHPGWLEKSLRTILSLAEGRVGVRARGDFDLMPTVADFLPEVILFDRLMLGSTVSLDPAQPGGKSREVRHPRWSPGYATAALLMLARDGEEAMAFLESVRDISGSSVDDQMSATNTVYSWPKSQLRNRQYTATTRGKATLQYFADIDVMLNAYTAWTADELATFTTYPQGRAAYRKVTLAFHPFAKK